MSLQAPVPTPHAAKALRSLKLPAVRWSERYHQYYARIGFRRSKSGIRQRAYFYLGTDFDAAVLTAAAKKSEWRRIRKKGGMFAVWPLGNQIAPSPSMVSWKQEEIENAIADHHRDVHADEVADGEIAQATPSLRIDIVRDMYVEYRKQKIGIGKGQGINERSYPLDQFAANGILPPTRHLLRLLINYILRQLHLDAAFTREIDLRNEPIIVRNQRHLAHGLSFLLVLLTQSRLVLSILIVRRLLVVSSQDCGWLILRDLPLKLELEDVVVIDLSLRARRAEVVRPPGVLLDCRVVCRKRLEHRALRPSTRVAIAAMVGSQDELSNMLFALGADDSSALVSIGLRTEVKGQRAVINRSCLFAGVGRVVGWIDVWHECSCCARRFTSKGVVLHTRDMQFVPQKACHPARSTRLRDRVAYDQVGTLMRTEQLVEVERKTWRSFEERPTAIPSPRRRPRPSQFSRGMLYRTADRICDAFVDDYQPAHPSAKAVVVDPRAEVMPAWEAAYRKHQPLGPGEVCFSSFPWSQDRRHREQGISVGTLSWALWIIECDHAERVAHEQFQSALQKLAHSTDRRSLAPRLERLVRRYPRSAEVLKPEVVVGDGGREILRWTPYVERGLSYENFKSTFGRALHRAEFRAMINALSELGLIAVIRHSSKRRRANIYRPV